MSSPYLHSLSPVKNSGIYIECLLCSVRIVSGFISIHFEKFSDVIASAFRLHAQFDFQRLLLYSLYKMYSCVARTLVRKLTCISSSLCDCSSDSFPSPFDPSDPSPILPTLRLDSVAVGDTNRKPPSSYSLNSIRHRVINQVKK